MPKASNIALDRLTSSYDYHLPEALIAQGPAEQRDHSQLLVYDRQSGAVQYAHFYNLPQWLQPGDLLILNNTRVIPARIFGTKAHTGTPFEFLLLRHIQGTEWMAIAKHSRRVKPGYRFIFNAQITGEIVERTSNGQCRIIFHGISEVDFLPWLKTSGEVPFPPYITERIHDGESRYQTVYGTQEGSVAASTAGLHFTDPLLAQLQKQGIQTAFVTLHIGMGTFSPVRVDKLEDHPMHSETYTLSEETACLLNQQKQNGKRIIAVGTTVTRVLETVFRKYHMFKPESGETNLFIYPGQTIEAIDALLTNFHLPRSTLMMLVSAWVGRNKLLGLYQEAIDRKYRFYSFGDGMLLL